MINIKITTSKEDLEIIANLGTLIWQEYYTPIIGSDQVEYMLKKFQSVTAIENQIQEKYSYYILLFSEVPVGYLSVVEKENSLFLSKIYVLKSARGKGVGKFAMRFIQKEAEELNLNSIKLTVNRYNENSIKAYEKMGFKITGTQVADIGNGFVMDDFLMENILG